MKNGPFFNKEHISNCSQFHNPNIFKISWAYFSGWLTGTVLVEVVEGGPEFGELLLGDALGVARQDLVLDLIDGAVDGGEQLFPAHAEGLHRVLWISEKKKNWVTEKKIRNAGNAAWSHTKWLQLNISPLFYGRSLVLVNKAFWR